MTKQQLANKIFDYICANQPVTTQQLKDRAKSHDLDPQLFYDAMVLIHARKDISATGDPLVYTHKIPVSRRSIYDTSDLVLPPYPKLIEGVNDCSHPVFAGMDYSYLFLNPEEHYKKYGVRHGTHRPTKI
jgi:hypothetical protein